MAPPVTAAVTPPVTAAAAAAAAETWAGNAEKDPIPKGCPTSPPVTWSNSDVLRWLILIDETDFLELFVKRKVTGRTLLLLHLDDTEKQQPLGAFVKKYVPDVEDVLHSDPVHDQLRQDSLALHIEALKLYSIQHKGWTTEVEFRVWSEYFDLGLGRSLAVAHQAVWRRKMQRFNFWTTLLSGFAALIGTLGLAIFQEQQAEEIVNQDNNTNQEYSAAHYEELLAETHVGSFRWWWSLWVTLISLLVTLVSAQAAKRAPKAEVAIKLVDRYSVWVHRCRCSRCHFSCPMLRHPIQHA